MELTKVEESELRVSAEEFVAILSNMLATATRVERANWHAFTSLSSDEATVPHHFVQAHVEIGFRGAAQSRTSFIWEVEAEFREHQSELKLAKLAVSKGHSVHSPEPPFVDISSESGFNGLKDRGFVGNSTSSSLSVFDYNKDGYWDIATSFDNQISDLYVNDGQGGFRRENLPLDVETKLCNNIFQMWVDLDGDGQEELLTTELTAATSKSPSLKLYRTGPSGKLQQVPESPFRFEHLDAPRKPKFSHITVCDIEGDGDLDVLYGGWVYDDGFLLRKLDGDGAKNLLFVNEGDLKFTEQSVARGLVEYKQTLFTECFDFDQDGDMDVLFGNDFAGNGYFENDGRGHFVRNSAHAFNKDVGFTMGMGISDYDNQGEYSVYLANMYSMRGID